MPLPLVSTNLIKINNAALKALRQLDQTGRLTSILPGTFDRLVAYQLVDLTTRDGKVNPRGREVLSRLSNRPSIPKDCLVRINFTDPTTFQVPYELDHKCYTRAGALSEIPF